MRALEALGAPLKGAVELHFTYDEEFGGGGNKLAEAEITQIFDNSILCMEQSTGAVFSGRSTGFHNVARAVNPQQESAAEEDPCDASVLPRHHRDQRVAVGAAGRRDHSDTKNVEALLCFPRGARGARGGPGLVLYDGAQRRLLLPPS